MSSELHSHLAAAYVQDRMAEATEARRVREARRAQAREPKLRIARRWFGRGARLETGLAPVSHGLLGRKQRVS